MSIRVRYFASLRDHLGKSEETLSPRDCTTVGEVWAKVHGGAALPYQVLCAVNMEYAETDTPVHAGDEIAFFPPVTGG